MLSFLAQTDPSWSPHTFAEWFGSTAAFGALGIFLLILALVLLDKVVLKRLNISTEIGKGNLACAILLGAFGLGMAIIIGKAIGI